MPNRSRDWPDQALRDLEQAEASRDAGRHEWACFAGQQAAEKTVKVLHLRVAQEAWGHVVAKLLVEPPAPVRVPKDLAERDACSTTSPSRPAIRTAIRKAPTRRVVCSA